MSGSICSLLGVWIQRLAIGWHAWQLSESPVVVGLVSAVQFLPVIVLTPFLGVFVDQIRAQTGSVVANALMGTVAAVMGVVTLQGLMTTELLVILALTQGVITSYYTPTRLALLPDLVPTRLFQSSVAIQAICFNLSKFVGPGLAGLIIAAWGIGWSYLINAISYLPVILSVSMLRIDYTSKPARKKGPYLERLKEGINYARAHPQIRMAISLALAGAFFGRGLTEIMPAFVAMVFEGGSTALATMMAGSGVGALIGSFAMSTQLVQQRLPSVMAFGCFGVVTALTMFGFAHSLPFGVLSIGVLGLSTTLVAVGSQTLVQIRVDDQLRGRVMSLWTLVGMGGPAVGGLVCGFLVRDIGPHATAFFYAGGCLLLVAAVVRGRDLKVRQPSA